jgi:hypothetical protein
MSCTGAPALPICTRGAAADFRTCFTIAAGAIPSPICTRGWVGACFTMLTGVKPPPRLVRGVATYLGRSAVASDPCFMRIAGAFPPPM